jgi:hypothetical protein
MTVALAREIHEWKVRRFFRTEGQGSCEKGGEERPCLHAGKGIGRMGACGKLEIPIGSRK